MLGEYAAALERCGHEVLRGDRAAFDQIARRARRELILTYVEDWARFVDRIRRGFTGTIAEYTSGITARGQLQALLETWKGDRSEDPRAQVERLDRMFEEVTEAIATLAPVPGTQYSVLPSPDAMRWWRRPKTLVGALSDYFAMRSR